MTALRAFVRDRPSLALLLVAAALALRVLVPGGFMPVVDHGRIAVMVCTGMADGPARMELAIPGLPHDPAPASQAQGKCAYADLAQAMTGGADPVLLAAAVAFALALALVLTALVPPRAAPWLRPPLRGPPALT